MVEITTWKEAQREAVCSYGCDIGITNHVKFQSKFEDHVDLNHDKNNPVKYLFIGQFMNSWAYHIWYQARRCLQQIFSHRENNNDGKWIKGYRPPYLS